MESCIFCKIAKHEIPHYPVYENDAVLSFLDIHPTAFGHTLVIPKKHYAHLKDTPNETRISVLDAVDKIMPTLKDATGALYIMIMIAGVDVEHFHIHLLPQYAENSQTLSLPTKTEEFEHLRLKIVSNMPV